MISSNRSWYSLIGLSAVLALALAWLSVFFPYGVDPEKAPLGLYVALGVVAGFVLLGLRLQITETSVSRQAIAVLVVAGFAMRMAMIWSQPVIEDDSYRYLWDGAVLAHGINPYIHAPVDAAQFDALGIPNLAPVGSDIAALQALAAEHPEFHARVAYPWVKTIYPPIAQGAFVVAHWISPFELVAWKAILLLSDLGALALMFRLLSRLRRSPLWAALYWLNPVVVTQGFGAAHMDILLAPFLLGAVLASLQNRAGLAGLALGGAVAVKLWPLLLVPAFAARFWPDVRHLAKYVLAGGAMLLLLVPQLLAAHDPNAGVVAYSETWQRHAFLFPILVSGFNIFTETPDLAARALVALIVGCIALALAARAWSSTTAFLNALSFPILALLLLSPTGYPWYLIWLAVLLPFNDSRAVFALFITAPLYQLRFLLGDDDALYQSIVIPISFGLPILALVWEWGFARKARAYAI